MKKLFISIIILAFVSVNLFAQDDIDSAFADTTGPTQYFPTTGNWGLGVDMTPFLRYAGTLIGGGSNISPSFGFTTQQPLTITGKYFLDDKSAIRIAFRIGSINTTENQFVSDDADSTHEEVVLDSKQNKQSNIAFGVGYEKRRGENNLKAIYGGMLLFSYASNKTDYFYGNTMAVNNPSPTSYNWPINNSLATSSRPVSDYQGTALGLKLYAFGGIEYFFLPMMSASAEITYGVNYTHLGEGTKTFEVWNSLDKKTETSTQHYHTQSFFSLDTGISGALNLIFYF
jgi:hypothetical protein